MSRLRSCSVVSTFFGLTFAASAAADQSLYLAKPSKRTDESEVRRDPYLSALDETAIALMNRHDPEDLLETIIVRAAALLGPAHGFIYLVEPDSEHLVVQHGIGLFADFLGYRLPVTTGLGGTVFREGRPVAVDDYDAWSSRSSDLPSGVFGAVVGVPLTSGGRSVGVIGLASGSSGRSFGTREIGALSRFAQLASIALDNAHLFEAAQRGMWERPPDDLMAELRRLHWELDAYLEAWRDTRREGA